MLKPFVKRERADMADAAPVARQWTLLRMLSAQRLGLTVDEAAAELQVAVKTIRRDLRLFQQLGFRLEETVGEHGRKRYRLDTGHGAPPSIGFAVDEALALYLGRRFLEPLAGTLFWQAAQSAFRKIRASFGRTALDYVEKMAARLHQTAVGQGNYAAQADLIDRLLQGIEDRRATHILYRSARATESVEYEIHPYGLAMHRGSLYLVAWSRDHDELRHFKVDRLEEVHVSQFPFRPLPDFNLADHLANSFGIFHGEENVEVEIRFSREVARYVSESTWHPSQQLAPHPDGTLTARFQLSTTTEIKQWILSFGRHAEAIAPKELRQELRNECAEMAKRYQPTKKKPSPASRREQTK